MDVVAESVKIAASELRRCYGDDGIFAGLHQFKDYWARDSCFAGLGALSIGDHEIVKKNLELFIKSVDKNGQLPLRVGKSSIMMVFSTLGLISVDSSRSPIYYADKGSSPPVDQNSLFVICFYNYIKKTRDTMFLKNNIDTVKKIMLWNFMLDRDNDLLIEEKEYANWADSVKKKGKVLYTNVCHCHALFCISELFALVKDKKNQNMFKEYSHKVKKKINELFWNGEHYLDWIYDGRQYNYFSTDGNMLAILWDIADNTKARHIEECSHIFDINDVPSGCVHPFYPNNLVSLPLRMIGLGDYHNGLSWIWLGSINALAKNKLGRKKEALHLLERIAELIVKFNGVFEVYDKSGKPVNRFLYKSESPFAWSSGLYLHAVKTINK